MSTKFDVEAIANAGQHIGRLMDDMSAFEALKQNRPYTGTFKPAAWLEGVVDNRRQAVVGHAEHLKIAFGEMGTKLKDISERFKNTDGQNAEEIKKVIAGIEGAVVQAVDTYDTNTEKPAHGCNGSSNDAVTT
ncbi:hypothetical protein ACFQ68_16470 [Amycolatopsis japonica]|uniref:hypothetical protein n=1 Tax=Amycolatopsis japonica TaxID=208439 RepID=UPI003671C5B6